jgi:hypothetical protein
MGALKKLEIGHLKTLRISASKLPIIAPCRESGLFGALNGTAWLCSDLTVNRISWKKRVGIFTYSD